MGYRHEVDCNEMPIYLVSGRAEMTLGGLGHSLGVQRCIMQKSAELASCMMKNGFLSLRLKGVGNIVKEQIALRAEIALPQATFSVGLTLLPNAR